MSGDPAGEERWRQGSNGKPRSARSARSSSPDVSATIAHYRRLGFELRFAEPEDAPFFAIVGRGGAQIFLKELGEEVPPTPNPGRHPWAAWDAFVHVDDPDALAAEFEAAGLPLHVPLRNRDDGLRGFEIADPDGYILFFGRPV